MKKNAILIVLILCLLMSACKTSSTAPTPLPGQVDTQIAVILTSMPTSTTPAQTSATSVTSPTQTPVKAATATTIPLTATPAATATPPATATPNASPTPTLTATSTSVPTLSATATFPPGDPRLKLGNPFWQDTFANDLNWPTGTDKLSSIDIKNNTLSLTALTLLDGWRLSYPTLQNFYLEASMKSGNCVASDHFGLIIRVPDKTTANQGYLFGISCDGQYSLRYWNGTKMSSLVNWTTSSTILAGPDKLNRLGIMAVGNHLGIYANGVLLASSIDNNLTQGAFGIFVGGKTTNLTVTVTSIAYWENP